MESVKVPVNGKSIVLKNGVELTYCEFGEENKDVIIVSQYYFITFHPWLQAMASRYHVYGVVMRMDGPASEYYDDGEIWWNHQWAEDVYDFACEMGIDKFAFAGKCHGSWVGWALLQKHPEKLTAFIPISLLPGMSTGKLPNENFMNIFGKLRFTKGERAFIEATVRKPENVEYKLTESACVVPADVMKLKHQDAFEELSSYEQIEEFYHTVNVPVLLIYSTDDPGYLDCKDQIHSFSRIIKGARMVTLQGEKHFFEIDIPNKLGREICFYLDELKQPLE